MENRGGSDKNIFRKIRNRFKSGVNTGRPTLEEQLQERGMPVTDRSKPPQTMAEQIALQRLEKRIGNLREVTTDLRESTSAFEREVYEELIAEGRTEDAEKFISRNEEKPKHFDWRKYLPHIRIKRK